MKVGRTANTIEMVNNVSAKISFLCEIQPSTLHEALCASKASMSGRSKNTPFGKYTSKLKQEIKRRIINFPMVRFPLVHTQNKKNRATVNAECACDQAG